MTDPVLEAVREWRNRGTRFALATVVGVRGSTYRGLAARQLVGEDGTSVGTVSGGCLDNDLRHVAARVIESGVAERVEFDLTADDEAIWGWGVGCNGATDLLVEPDSTAADLADMLSLPGTDQLCMVHPVPDPTRRRIVRPSETADDPVTSAALEALAAGRHRSLDVGSTRYLLEVVGAPPRLVVFGAGHDAAPVVAFGAWLGFRTMVVDDRRQFLTAERFPEAHDLIHADSGELARTIGPDQKTFVVLMSHNYLRDLEALRSLLGTEVAYIGALGPGERLQRLLDDLAESGGEASEGDLAKMYGPAGLDIGAEGPVEIAWSVLAEVLAVARDKNGGPLRNRKGPEPVRGF
ncbi:MAG: XdhC family protein [Acidimicrobiia bacterium]|nr:XdhC family protein [Acidimicrobiia bacterium]